MCHGRYVTFQLPEAAILRDLFVVDGESLPDGLVATHRSLFDGTLAGMKMTNRPVFSVQYHPEASPGPQDSTYLFRQFTTAMEGKR